MNVWETLVGVCVCVSLCVCVRVCVPTPYLCLLEENTVCVFVLKEGLCPRMFQMPRSWVGDIHITKRGESERHNTVLPWMKLTRNMDCLPHWLDLFSMFI